MMMLTITSRDLGLFQHDLNAPIQVVCGDCADGTLDASDGTICICLTFRSRHDERCSRKYRTVLIAETFGRKRDLLRVGFVSSTRSQGGRELWKSARDNS